MTFTPKKRRIVGHDTLALAVDRFLLAFETAKATPWDGKLLDRLTASVLRLEAARNRLR